MVKETCSDSSADPGIAMWMDKLPPWARAGVALMFMFTIWSVFTGFDLGNIMNKIADAQLEQQSMQFQAQLELQQLQFHATEQSNDKLETLIASVNGVSERLDTQGEQIVALIRRVDTLEKRQDTASIGQQFLLDWACNHEPSGNKPDYCFQLD